jgi:glucose/arabinose dehydrogenase
MADLLQRGCTTLLLCIALGLVSERSGGQTFRIDTLARAPFAQYPVAIAFIPHQEEHFFFTEKSSGRVRIYDGGLKPEPFAIAQVDDDGEQGLLGIAIHPRYPFERYVYVFYTRLIDRSNVVVRYKDDEEKGVDPVMIQIIPRQDDGTSNNGGAIHFGPDGKLYVAVGDYGTNPGNAQDITSRRNYRGKILRLNADGSMPTDNPVAGTPFWSYGHRNPAGFTFDEQTGILYCVDGGTNVRNQVFAVPPGANLGWPGDRSRGNGNIIKPLYTFPSGPQPALTSIVVYRGPGFPRLQGKILFGGYAQPTIWAGTLTQDRSSLTVEPFFRSNAGYADIELAPDGSIVFTNGPFISSRILKIAPIAPAFLSTPPSVAIEHLAYTYTPSFSGTPPGLELIEAPRGMIVDSTSWSLRWIPTWIPSTGGQVVVHLRAENGAGFVDQRFTLQVINVNDPPTPFSLLEPAEGAGFTFLGIEPEMRFRWQSSMDPDNDTLRYIVQLDTTAAFNSPACRDTVVYADSVRLMLPKRSGTYFWQVTAGDGTSFTPASAGPRKVSITYFTPALSRSDRDRIHEPALEQNFPNPFNPSTSIKYAVQRSGYVRLAVYNLLGQEVALLVDGQQSEGIHEVEFAKANLPSGIYFYRLQAPGMFETKKMVIAR